MSVFKRAIRDTLSGQIQALFMVIAGGGLGLIYLYFARGRKVAFEEVPYFGAAVFGALGALVLLFAWNLVCAPYRIERDKRVSLEDENTQLKARMPSPARRRMTADQRTHLSDAVRQAGVSPKPIYMAFFTSSNERANLAEDISAAFRQAGLDVTFVRDFFHEDDPSERGVKIHYGRSKTLSKLADAVHGALKDAGIQSERIRASEGHGFKIYVARASE